MASTATATRSVRKVVKEAKLDLDAVYPELFEPPAREVEEGDGGLVACKGGFAAGRAAKHADRAGSAVESPAPSLGRVLLTPTRLYADPIVRLLRSYSVKNVVTGMAHITGSGIPGNLCRRSRRAWICAGGSRCVAQAAGLLVPSGEGEHS